MRTTGRGSAGARTKPSGAGCDGLTAGLSANLGRGDFVDGNGRATLVTDTRRLLPSSMLLLGLLCLRFQNVNPTESSGHGRGKDTRAGRSGSGADR
jgi:hypothetical protein